MPASLPMPQLSYPLYLDVPMMIGLLATIEDGLDVGTPEPGGDGEPGSGEERSGAGRRLAALLGSVPFDLQGRLIGDSDPEEREAQRLIKRHTEASLFNTLRRALYERTAVQVLDERLTDGDAVQAGMIVETAGLAVRNPLDELLSFGQRFRPMIEDAPTPSPTAPRRSPQQRQRRRNRVRDQQEGGEQQGPPPPGPTPQVPPVDPFTVLDWVREDLTASELMEIVLYRESTLFPQCLLTLSKASSTGPAVEALRGAEVSVLGKVLTVVRDGEPTSLLRRSILGSMSRKQRFAMFGALGQHPAFRGMTDALEVNPPFLQIMPIAIFI